MKKAARISIERCDCPNIHVFLHDRHGREFAVATMDIAVARALAADILTSISEAEKAVAADAIGRCAGHA